MEAPTPIRPADEVVGAYVSITLGGKEYRLAELPRRANREWQKRLSTDVRARIEGVGPLETADEVIEAIADSAELMMDLLIEYDAAGVAAWNAALGESREAVLPERDWIDTHATDRECYEAIKKVAAVSFPFGIDLIHMVPEFLPMLLQAVQRGTAAATLVMMGSSASTSSSRRNTAGSQTPSSAA